MTLGTHRAGNEETFQGDKWETFQERTLYGGKAVGMLGKSS